MREITFVLWDESVDGVAIKVDGKVVWQEQGWGYLDQFLRYTDLLGQPVILKFEEGGKNG